MQNVIMKQQMLTYSFQPPTTSVTDGDGFADEEAE